MPSGSEVREICEMGTLPQSGNLRGWVGIVLHAGGGYLVL